MPTNPNPTGGDGITEPAALLDELSNEVDELKKKIEKISKQLPEKPAPDNKE